MFHEISGLDQPVATINQRRTVLGFISWIIMGLIVGVLAKWIMPGKDPGGLFITIGIGIAGAFVGGFIGAKLGFGAVTGFNIGSILIATGGAVLLLAIYRAMKKKQ
jgi:uncharacterized membrane protein YeaQ/YmgE (transglycosylase-associated protein family)